MVEIFFRDKRHRSERQERSANPNNCSPTRPYRWNSSSRRQNLPVYTRAHQICRPTGRSLCLPFGPPPSTVRPPTGTVRHAKGAHRPPPNGTIALRELAVHARVPRSRRALRLRQPPASASTPAVPRCTPAHYPALSSALYPAPYPPRLAPSSGFASLHPACQRRLPLFNPTSQRFPLAPHHRFFIQAAPLFSLPQP